MESQFSSSGQRSQDGIPDNIDHSGETDDVADSWLYAPQGRHTIHGFKVGISKNSLLGGSGETILQLFHHPGYQGGATRAFWPPSDICMVCQPRDQRPMVCGSSMTTTLMAAR